MKVLVCTSLALMCIVVSHGQNCATHRPITSSFVECDGEVYRRSQDRIDAHNACYDGTWGSDLTVNHMNCVAERIGVLRNGVPVPGALSAILQNSFPHHYQPLVQGLEHCAALDRNNALHPACINQVFENVCKHRTCDWINSY